MQARDHVMELAAPKTTFMPVVKCLRISADESCSVLRVSRAHQPYQICCSGAEGGPGEYEWRIFVSLVKRLLRKRPPDEMAEELFESVLDCLKEAEIGFSVEPA
jgi:hypothetical protein